MPGMTARSEHEDYGSQMSFHVAAGDEQGTPR